MMKCGKTCHLLYFFSYKTEFLSFQNNAKNLDPSIFLRLFRKGNICIIAKFHMTDLFILGHSKEWKTPSYSQINKITPAEAEIK